MAAAAAGRATGAIHIGERVDTARIKDALRTAAGTR